MKRIIGIFTFLSLLSPITLLAAEAPVGTIKTVIGNSSVVRNGGAMVALSGADLFQSDVLRTGGDGTISVLFKDETMISVGPNSELSIKEFRFSPGEGNLSFVARLLKGTSAYVSGLIGKLSPQSVRFETPVANIGIRGTKFAVKLEGDE